MSVDRRSTSFNSGRYGVTHASRAQFLLVRISRIRTCARVCARVCVNTRRWSAAPAAPTYIPTVHACMLRDAGERVLGARDVRERSN